MVYQATSVLPDPDTEVKAWMSGTIPVIEFCSDAASNGSVTVHTPGATRREQAEWLSSLAAKVNALAEAVVTLDSEAVSS